MPQTFEECDRLFRTDRITELSRDAAGVRFLKLRSLNRKGGLERLYRIAQLEIPEGSASQVFRAAFQAEITVEQIEACIRALYAEERIGRREQEPELINQLYRMQEFNWGGLHQNSLEKTIVDNYVKKIRNFDLLNEAIESELYASLRGYVLCSWYNHWASIMIEDVFKDHPNVLPAVGLIKKIDFFISDIPFDLKVTYLPEGYIVGKRKAGDLRPELTLLKRVARLLDVPIPADLSSGALLQDLWIKISDHPRDEAQQLMRELKEFRNRLVTDVKTDPSDLIKWLYEEQGIRRFDASNRLFLVLVDQRNYFESWKLKRAKPLLQTQVGEYLDGAGRDLGREIKFQWEGENFSVRSDLLVVTNTENALPPAVPLPR